MCKGRLLLWHPAGRELNSIPVRQHLSRNHHGHHRYCAAAPLQLNGLRDPFPVDAELDLILSLDPHRYPDPSHSNIKSRIAELRGLPSTDHVFLGVGSDEVIDLPMRISASAWRTREYSRLVWSMRACKRLRSRQGQP